MRVHVSGEMEAELVERLERRLRGNVELTIGKDVPEDCTVLVKGVVSKEDLAGLSNLEAIVVPWAGLPALTRETALDRPDLAVYNLHHNADSTAETAIALVMACARRTVPLDRAMRGGDWAPRYEESEALKLSGKKATVLGYGAVGRKVAAVLSAMGMSVSAVKRTVRQGFDGDVSLYAPTGLDTLFRSSTVLVVTLPLTLETKGLISAERLALLPPNAVVVNVARGGIVDEEALFEAAAGKKLHSVGLDVWWNYPTKGETSVAPGQKPWHTLDNVVMSPHVGGASQDAETDRIDALGDLIAALASGEKPSSRVDPAKGY